jgi:ketosteroid isomerase-like protein
MPHKNVEVVKRAGEAFDRGDLDATREFLHADFEMVQLPITPFAGTYKVDAAFETMDEWIGAFEELRWEREEYIEAGEQVVGVVREIGRPRGGEVELDHRFAIVYTLRDGKILRMEWFNTPAEALETVGLPERSDPAES